MDSHKAPRADAANPEDILAQIARLTAKLPRDLQDTVIVKERPSKRKEPEEPKDRSNVLIAASPSLSMVSKLNHYRLMLTLTLEP